MLAWYLIGLIDGPLDIAVAMGMLAVAVLAYRIVERVRPGAGNFPPEFSAALRWLDRHAEDEPVLAWWDYAAPLEDHTDVEPILCGPSDSLREWVDDPDRVRRWVADTETARVGAFLMADTPKGAFEYVSPGEFSYLLVARSDLRKAPAIREAALMIDGFRVEDPGRVLLRRLIAGSVDWPVVFENEQVTIYRSPESDR